MPDYSNTTDEELVAISLQDQDGFYHLMMRYEQKILRYIQRITNITLQKAEEIAQEVFIKVYRNLNDFDQDLKFSSWIYRIAHNEVIDYFRRKARLETVSLDNSNDEEEGSLLNILQDTLDIHQDFLTKETSLKVHEAIATLPEKYREILVLRYLEEKDYTEIGDILRKPGGTVATLINRAKKQFREAAMKVGLDNLIDD